MKKRALLIGDAVASTGFARMNRAYIDGLIRDGWDVDVLGINYFGDPHTWPCRVWSCTGQRGGDAFGVRRSHELVTKLRPNVVLLSNDPWNVPNYLNVIGNVPTIGSLAVDGRNCRGADLNGLRHAIFWTEFALREAAAGGYRGTADVIPLGVDAEVYTPGDRLEARQRLGLPAELEGAFIIGAVGRNQPRKRLDLLLHYFAQWIQKHRVDDAFLYLHVAPTGDVGFDLKQLAAYLGISNRIVMPPIEAVYGISDERLTLTYRAFDILATTTQGEGWGLTAMEAMSCGIPIICPDWAALAEWTVAEPEHDARQPALRVPVTSYACTPNNINAIGGIAGAGEFVAGLEVLYRDRELREDMGRAAATHVRQRRFSWEDIGSRYAQSIAYALEPVLTNAD